MSLLASLQIHLDHSPNHVYRPNYIVTGYIALIPPLHRMDMPKLGTPSIALWGKSSTWLCRNVSDGDNSSEYINYMDSAELMNVSLNLGHGAQPTRVGQEYRWLFSFYFPEGTGNNRTGCYKHSDDERWTTLPHPLPPSFSFGNNRHIISGLPKYADISYGLAASMSLPTDFLTAKATINFQPSNPDLNLLHPHGVLRFSAQHTLHTSLLKGDESSLGFRKRIHDRFSSNIPELSFDLALDIPISFTAGAEFRLHALGTVTHKTADVAHIPPIRLRISKIELIDHTCIRAPVNFEPYIEGDLPGWPSNSSFHTYNPHLQPMHARTEETSTTEDKTPLNCVPQEHIVELGDGGHCEAWFPSWIPSYMAPSFRSFAISRRYTMRIKLEAQIGGKKFELKAESWVRSLGGVSLCDG